MTITKLNQWFPSTTWKLFLKRKDCFHLPSEQYAKFSYEMKNCPLVILLVFKKIKRQTYKYKNEGFDFKYTACIFFLTPNGDKYGTLWLDGS